MRARDFIFNLPESTLVQVSLDRNSNYLKNLNLFLSTTDEEGKKKTVTPFEVYIDSGRKPKDKVLFRPNPPNQTVVDQESEITGSIQNKKGNWVKLPGYQSGKNIIPLKVKHVYKSSEIKGATEKLSNKGETAEGWHAAAVFARFIKRPDKDISQKDVEKIINKLELNTLYALDVSEVENKAIADKFEIMINLKPKSWADFKDTSKIALQQGIFNTILSDANRETAVYAHEYATNDKFDKINILGDGVSGETTTKTDINFEHRKKKVKKKGFSIKAGSTNQIDQFGGGKVVGSLEMRLEKLRFFDQIGADVMKVKKQFLAVSPGNGSLEHVIKRNIIAQQIAYKSVNKQINDQLAGDSKANEKKFLLKLINALKHFIRKDEEGVQLKQFTDKGYYILDVENLNKLESENNLDLASRYYEDGPGNPVVDIYDKVTEGEAGEINATIVRFRSYRSSTGYLRTYVEKGDMLIHLTLAGGSEAYWGDAESEQPGSKVKFSKKRSNTSQVQYDKQIAAQDLANEPIKPVPPMKTAEPVEPVSV